MIPARRGESLLAALVASHELRLREFPTGEYRGPFCGMGVCQDCLVEVDGAPATRACLTTVEASMTVRRQANRVTAASIPIADSQDAARTSAPPLESQVVVVGAGPGGIIAALSAANAGADVLLIDERPKLGGQYYKQPVTGKDLNLAEYDDPQFRGGRELIDKLERSNVTVLRAVRVVGAYESLDLVVALENETRLVRPQKLIAATGAYEICYPFEGWTLPGVMTTGAAQTLLRSYRVVPGRQVLIAGNGPLNFQVAAELINSGVESVTLIEAANRPGLSACNTIARMMTTAPGLTLKGAGYLSSLLRARASIRYGEKILSVEPVGDAGGLSAIVGSVCGDESTRHEIEVDAICLGYGFRPSNEITRAFGCKHDATSKAGALQTARDDDCLTSRDDIFAVGDCAGMNGAPAAEADGLIAGSVAAQMLGFELSAQQEERLARARSLRGRHARFQNALWTLFEPVGDVFEVIDNDAIACRCENLTHATIQQVVDEGESGSMGTLKRATRAGMGRCQGRYCGPAIAKMLAAKIGRPLEEADLWAPRPPIKPVRIRDLAKLHLLGDD